MSIPVPSIRPRADWLARSILSGFTASVVMVIAFFVAFGFAHTLGSIRLTDRRGAVEFTTWAHALTNNVLIDTAGDALYAAGAFHLVVGVGLAVLYGYAVEPRLPGDGWVRGLTFSIVPWLLSLFAFFPVVGAGVAGLGLGAGPLPAVGNLILHLVYGATLGAVYGPLGDRPADSFPFAGPADAPEVTSQVEQSVVRGVLVGVLLGLVAGGIGMAFTSSPTSLTHTIPGGAVLFVPAVVGGAFGAAIGPFFGGGPGNE